METSAEAAILARAENRKAPSQFRAKLDPHLECGRPDVGCYVGLVGLSGAVLASDTWSVWQLVVAFLAPAFVCTGAYYAGALFDRDVNAVAKPGRPVPSGRMTTRTALIGMVACAVIGVALTVTLTWFAVVLVLALVLTGLLYRRFGTRRRPVRVFVRGIATMMAFGATVWMTSGSPLWDLILLGLIFWQQDSMLHQILAVEDTEVDRRARISTLPTRYGHKAALVLLVVTLVFWVSSAAFQPASVRSRSFDPAAYAPFVVVATVLVVTAIVLLFRAPRPIVGRPVARAYGIIAVARPCVAAGFVAAAGDLLLGLVLLVVTLSITLLALRAVTSATRSAPPAVIAEPQGRPEPSGS